MIETFVQAGMTFNNNTAYPEARENAAKFIRGNLWKEGKLLRRFRERVAWDYEEVFSLDDYAYLIRCFDYPLRSGARERIFELGFSFRNDCLS
ncbi:MAG: hypothetical protein P0S93_01900 [Candidatus Neptunochlamydia sp.]|nr:hypothetical protein [Candidatus Neptunochlamydia sp.]